MDHYGYDQDMTNEYGMDLSVDDILSEFQAQWIKDSYGAYVPDEPITQDLGEPYELDSAPYFSGQTLYGEPEPAGAVYDYGSSGGYGAYAPETSDYGYYASEDTQDEDVRVYTPRGRMEAMEREARRVMDELPDETADEYAAEPLPPDEEDEEAPRRKKRSGVRKKWSFGRREKKHRFGRRAETEAEEAFAESAEEYTEDYTKDHTAGGEAYPEALDFYREAQAESAPADPTPAPTYAESGAESYDWLSVYKDLRGQADYGTGYEGYDAPPATEEAPVFSSAVAVAEAPAAVEERPAYPAPISDEPFDLEIDQRFNIDGRRGYRDYLDDSPLPEEAYTSAGDEDYLPPEDAFAAHIRQEAEAERETQREGTSKRRLPKFHLNLNSKKKQRPLNAPLVPGDDMEDDLAAGFVDISAAPGQYAPAGDYEEDYAREAEREAQAAEPSFPSFKEYLQSLVTGFVFRARGFAGGDSTATMVDTDEDLGPEVTPAAASKHYGAFVHTLRTRFRISLVLLIIMCYISLGLPVTGMLKSVHVAAGMCLAIQFTILLLSLDVVTGAILNVTRRRLGADTMAVIACLLTSIDAMAVAGDLFGTRHMPLCALSSLSLCGVLLASLLSARGLRKALRVPAIGKRTYAVTAEEVIKDRTKGQDITLLKSVRSVKGFVRRSEEAAPDETAFIRFAPLILGAALLLGLIAAIASKSMDNIVYILSAILIPAVPVTALLSFSLPFFVGSMRIFSSGAAIAGWSGLCDIGQSRNLIVTDRDLFPEHCVELDSIRIFADEDSKKIIAYAGTMIVASGSGLAGCFGKLMEENGCALKHVESFEFLAGGGMKGVIDGQTVLCGSSDLMRLMNVRIPFRLVDRTTVLLAIDGILYGIFNMKYTPDPAVRKALVSLMRSNRHPVFAVRDFNITPDMLHTAFDIATDGYDFPPYVERFAISEAQATENSKIAAVVCREGLGSLTHMADTGRSMYVTVRINILLTLLSVAIGLGTVFIKLLSGGVSVGFLLVFALVWALPVAVLSLFLRF